MGSEHFFQAIRGTRLILLRGRHLPDADIQLKDFSADCRCNYSTQKYMAT
jgi:hypothetical protein